MLCIAVCTGTICTCSAPCTLIIICIIICRVLPMITLCFQCRVALVAICSSFHAPVTRLNPRSSTPTFPPHGQLRPGKGSACAPPRRPPVHAGRPWRLVLLAAAVRGQVIFLLCVCRHARSIAAAGDTEADTGARVASAGPGPHCTKRREASSESEQPLWPTMQGLWRTLCYPAPPAPPHHRRPSRAGGRRRCRCCPRMSARTPPAQEGAQVQTA